MRAFLAILIALPLLAGCLDGAPSTNNLSEPTIAPEATSETSPPSPEPSPATVPPAKPVRFLLLGDAGQGDQGQFDVGETMFQLCQLRPCDFAVYLGDNFYPAGVESERDPQWEEKFEKPYAKLDLPFYAALGNHDQSYLLGEGLSFQKGDHEVAYTFREDRSSEKWTMPARWYNFTAGEATGSDGQRTGAPLVEFFAMDTNVENFAQGDGSQAAWLQQGLEESSATWKFAFGHHLYSSNSMHGQSAEQHVYVFNTDFMRRFFQENVCGRADVLFSGHDHILEWLHPRSGCPGTELIISGAGHSGREITGSEPSYYTYGDGPGFGWVEVTDTELHLEYFHVGKTEPVFSQVLAKTAVGANEYQESVGEGPLPLSSDAAPMASFIAYADGGHDRAAQVRNSLAAQQVCADLGCDMVLHATGSISRHSEYAPIPDEFQWTWGNGVVEFFRVDPADDLAAQSIWLRSALAESKARWTVVYGAEPLAANGAPDAALRDPAFTALLRSVVCGHADLYVSGGSATLEWLDLPACSGTQLVIAGATSTVESLQAELLPGFVHDDSLGFWWMRATPTRFEARAFDDDADLLYQVELTA